MRLLFSALALLLASAGLTLVLKQENGYFLLGYGVWTIEGSLALFVLCVLLLFGVLYLLLRLLRQMWLLPDDMRAWNRRRMSRRAQRSLTRGLLELAEGQWQAAEKSLLSHAENSDTPLLNYLAGARAAQSQGADERRDHYLRLAHHSTPSADVAVGLTQAELQLSQGQLEQALATLNHLRGIAPQHQYVLKLLASLYERLQDWRALHELIPVLRKRKALEPGDLFQLELRVQGQLLAQSGERLEEFWNGLGRTLQRQPRLLRQYAQLQAARGQGATMERLLREALKNEWDESLIGLYGLLEGEDPVRMLSFAEEMLTGRPRDAVLLLALGRLALRARLWGKARNYLDASLGVVPTPEAFRELGALLERLEEPEAARDCYRKGLELATRGRSPTPVSAPERLGSRVLVTGPTPSSAVADPA